MSDEHQIHDDGPPTIGAVLSELKHLRTIAERMDKHLTGASEPDKGLLVQHRLLAAKVETIERDAEVHKETVKWWARTTIGAVIGVVVLAAWKVIGGKA